MNNTEQAASDLQAGYGNYMKRIWDGPDAKDVTFSVAVNICENCRQACEQLTYVPGFDYMGCDRCADEAFEIEQLELKRIDVQVVRANVPEWNQQEVA